MSYEPRDASIRVILISGGIMAFLVVASIAASAWVYGAQIHGPDVPPAAIRQTSFSHGAEEKIGILEDYAKVTKDSADRLNGYAWVDRNAGVVRIPIDRAMELMVHGAKPAPAPNVPGQVP